MQDVHNFLVDSRKEGVYKSILHLSTDDLCNYLAHIDNIRPKSYSKSSPEEYFSKIFHEKELMHRRFKDNFIRSLAFHILIDLTDEIKNFFSITDSDLSKIINDSESRAPFLSARRLLTSIFKSKLFSNINDAFYIDYKISDDKKTVIFEIITLKKTTVDLFSKFVTSLPMMETSLETVVSRKSHSENNVQKIYPIALNLYLIKENRLLINDGISQFLRASINYFRAKEWRTSIILSSIAVESLLAELYEEEYKKSPPDIPLGGLKKMVERKINFPESLSKKINDLNRCRIAAVHRSENPVSNKEAVTAMMGIASFIIWFFENY